MSYDDVFFNVPFSHLIFLTNSINPDLKEIEANNIITEKKFKNRIAPILNI